MLEKTVEIGILIDYYGNLLTDKQQLIMELRYTEDLSLAEIAEQLTVSRQAVHDVIHRTISQLYSYEEKLGLAHAHQQRQSALQVLAAQLHIQGCLSDEIRILINELMGELE
jgi:predicted DNA-binding protein YlxM (UPF0122 family)